MTTPPKTYVVRLIGVPGEAPREYLDAAPFSDSMMVASLGGEFFLHFMRDLKAEAFDPGVIVYRFYGVSD